MSFKMIGKFKYNLEKEIYEYDNNTLEVFEDHGLWVAVFNIEGREYLLEEDSYQRLDVAMNDFCYSLQTNEELINSFPKPPDLKDLDIEKFKKVRKEIEEILKENLNDLCNRC